MSSNISSQHLTFPSRWRYPIIILMVLVLATALYWSYSTVYTGLDLGWQWVATRAWLTGIDPYSPQMTFMLRPDVTSPTASGFAYPFPVILFMLPLAVLPMPLAATIWGLVSIAAITTLPWVVLKRPPQLAMLLPFFYFPFWASMEMAQWAPVMLVFVLLSLYWQKRGKLRMAGAMLPLLFFKPQFGIAIFVAIAAYQYLLGLDRRWLEGLVIGGILWWGTSLVIAPSWPWGWLQQLQNYSAEGRNAIHIFTPVGSMVALVTLIVTIRGWYRGNAALVLTGILVCGMLALPSRGLYNQAILLLPLVMLAGSQPRAALMVSLASWGFFVCIFLGVDDHSSLILSLYAPLAFLAALSLRSSANHTPFMPEHTLDNQINS